MRIRKRWSTPSSSSPPTAPPLAPSTPPHHTAVESLHHHHNHHEEEEAPPCNPHNQPTESEKPLHLLPPARSDLQLVLVKGTNGWVCKTDGDCMHPTPSTQLRDVQETSSSSAADTIHLRNKTSCGAKEDLGITVSTSPSHQDGNNNVLVEGASDTIKKKRKKADKDSVMTEGARCSRVNGRGWRCCHPTLVGYSLCEHHTSKGRVRTNNPSISKEAKDEKVGSSLSLSSSPSSSSLSINEKPLIKIIKRKKKSGMVKARSISSILVQTQPQCAPPLPIQILDSVTGL